MPEDKARKIAVRARMATTGERYTTAARALDAPFEPGLISVSDRMQESGDTYAEAVAWLQDPANRTMCDICGWTNGMVCPECPGCGCYNLRCSGWRHQEAMTDDELEELRQDDRCEECGASYGYDCNC
jgi:hypothetical protein